MAKSFAAQWFQNNAGKIMITKNDCRGKKSLLAAVIFALMDLRDFRFQLVGEGKELFGGHRLSKQEALRVMAIVFEQ